MASLTPLVRCPEKLDHINLACAFYAHFAPPVVAGSIYNQWFDYNYTCFHWNFYLSSLNYKNKFMGLRLWMGTS